MKDLQLIKIETAPIDPRISGDVVDCLSLSILAGVLREKGYSTNVYINSYEKDKHIQLLETIAENDPEVIGLTTKIFNVLGVEEATKYVAEKFPAKKIILGGTQFDKYFSKLFMEKNPQVHAILRGQGEITLPIVLERILAGKELKNIKGVTHRVNGKVIIEQNRPSLSEAELEALPMPVFDLIENIPLEERAGKTAQLRTSTGCDGTCRFCYNQEGRWRSQSAEKTTAQMEEYVKKGFRRFLIVDNNFIGNNLEHAVKFAQGVLGLRKKYNTELHFQFDARADSFGKHNEGFRHDILDLLVKAGLYDIFTGIEAGNALDLEAYGKCRKDAGQDMLEQNKFYLTEMNQYRPNTTVTGGFINFNPNSTLEQVRQNLNFIYQHFPPQFAPEVYWYSLSCYVGSKFTKDILKELASKGQTKAIEEIMYGEHTPQIRDDKVREFYEELYSLKPKLRDAYRVFATIFQENKDALKEDVNNLHKLNYDHINSLLSLVEENGTKQERTILKQKYIAEYFEHLRPYISIIKNLARTRVGDEYNSVLTQLK